MPCATWPAVQCGSQDTQATVHYGAFQRSDKSWTHVYFFNSLIMKNSRSPTRRPIAVQSHIPPPIHPPIHPFVWLIMFVWIHGKAPFDSWTYLLFVSSCVLAVKDSLDNKTSSRLGMLHYLVLHLPAPCEPLVLSLQ